MLTVDRPRACADSQTARHVPSMMPPFVHASDMPTPPRIAIVGAGPIGLEAALYAWLRGYDVTLYERGRIAENVRQWGHVRMFSPFRMNTSEWGRAALDRYDGEEQTLPGSEFVEQYLKPLSRLEHLNGCIRESADVIAIGRSHRRKSELIGDPQLAHEPFRLIVEHALRTHETVEAADVVLDCSGTYGHHNWLGAGGVPCPGEREAGHEIEYGIPDVLGADRKRYAGRRTLVIGAGHSAATSVMDLVRLKTPEPDTRILWVTRRCGPDPVRPIDNDSLFGRQVLTDAVNLFAKDSMAIDWLDGHVVRQIDREFDDSRYRVVLESVTDGRQHAESVDRIIANVGYRPDRSLYEELQIHECYATQGPMKLAAKLLGETSADCLDQTSHGADVLRNPEPNFYILGMKSYGRNSNFLIRVGLQQIVDVFSLIEHDWGPSPRATPRG
jgi:thioredoxin reductase